MWYKYPMEFYLATKKYAYCICSNMDEPRDCHTKWNKAEKDKYHMVLLAYGILKMIQINLFKKQKETHRQGRQTYGYQRRNEGKGWIRSLRLVDTIYKTDKQ